MKTPRFTITRGDEHDQCLDRLAIELTGLDGSPTGIRAATVEPDIHRTAAGWEDSDPAWDTASLLAAAPEMLEALRENERHLTRIARAFYVGGKASDLKQALAGWKETAEAARTAIALATKGEEP